MRAGPFLQVSYATRNSRTSLSFGSCRCLATTVLWLITVKRQRVAELQQLALRGALTSQASAHPRSDKPPRPACLAFLDSTDRHGCPDLGSVYGLVGHQLKGRFARFGQSLVCPLRQPGLSVGKGVYTIHHRKRAAELLEHLQLLIDSKPNTFWFVVLDNASAHTTAAIEAFAFHHRPRLELVYRPTYSPHLNLIERL